MKSIEFVFPIDNIDSTKFSILGFQFPQDHQELLAICYYNKSSIELKTCIINQNLIVKHNGIILKFNK